MNTKSSPLDRADRMSLLSHDANVTTQELEWFVSLPPEVRARLMASETKRPSDLLELLADETAATLPSLHGDQKLSTSGHVFKSVEFRNCCVVHPKRATPKTVLCRYEVTEHAPFSKVFASLGVPLDQLSLTQAQIVAFCKRYPETLRPRHFTFFLFKENNEFFVAVVDPTASGTLRVYVYNVNGTVVWTPGHRPQVVVPKLD